MTGALYILLSIVVVGLVLYLFELRNRKRKNAEEPESVSGPDGSSADAADSAECCGQHLVCEKESLSPFGEEIVYYDDEELDRFAGKRGDEYSEEEIEEIRDVLMTLRGEDLAGWARSITQRGIELPEEIRDELLLMVRERRGIK